jgi:hypothetical protein
LDQRTYNEPITSEVAAVWVEGNEGNTFVKNVILNGNREEIQSIKPYYGCYDPLSYPMFFPRGELGWHRKIPRNNIKEQELTRPAAEDNDEHDNPGNISHISFQEEHNLYIFGAIFPFPINATNFLCRNAWNRCTQ